MKTGKRQVKRKKVKGKRVVSLLKVFLPFTLYLLPFSLAYAEVQISASLDRQQVALNEQATLSVTISGDSSNLPSPQLPGLPNFQVYNAGTSQSFSWINGKSSANVTYTYMLSPKEVGRFTIPPIHVQGGGQAAETPALSLEVVKGQTASVPVPTRVSSSPGASQAPGLFITSTVDKQTVYVGEPVTLSFRLYDRVALLSNPQYQPPDTSGFWTEDLPPQRTYTASAKGAPFHVTEVRTALFPTAPGHVKIGPAGLRVQIQNFSGNPEDIFANFFGGGGQEKVLQTDPITIHVKPLPEPKPSGFKGAVGQYTLASSLDKTSTTVGQPLELTVTVAGKGNIKSLPDVSWPTFNNFRTFDANAATNIEKKNYVVSGSKVFKIVLIPTTSGTLSLPPVSYVYFDPEAGAYKTLHTSALSVSVKAAPPGSQPTGPLYAASGTPAGPGIQMLSQDIRYIHTPAHIPSQGTPLYRQSWLWVVTALAFLFMLISGCIPLYRRLFLSNPRQLRFRSARGMALGQLRKAEQLASQAQIKEAVRLLSNALQAYLAAKLLRNETGVALKEVIAGLQERKLPEAQVSQVQNLWNTLDLFQFAPAQVTPAEIQGVSAQLQTLIDALDKGIVWKP